MDQDRLKAIEKKLDEHGRTLRGIQEALNRVAVQQEQIEHIKADLVEHKRSWERLVDPSEGMLSKMMAFQGTCPREQIRWLWCIVIPQGLTTLGLGIAIIKILLGAENG